MSGRAYAIIVACFFTVGIAYAVRYGYGMLLPEMLPALSISKTQAGTIFAIYFVVYTLFSPVLGTLSDLFNYRFLITVFTAVLGLGALMMGFVNSFYQACLVFPIAGLGHAACWAPVTALVQKWVPDKKRGMILSFVTIGIGLAVPFWGTLIPFIVSVFDWRAGWAGMGLFGLAVAGLNLILVRNPAGQNNQGVSAKDRLKLVLSIYKSLIRAKQFWIIGTAYLLLGFNVLVPFTFLPVYSREALQFDYATSTRFVSLIAFFGIAGQLTLGPLSDRLGRVNIMMVCSTIMAIACLGMITSAAEWWLYAAASFYGLAYGAVWPVYAAAASDFFPSSQTGSVVGLWTVFLGLGSIVSPVLCGWTIDISGVYTWAFFLGILSGAFSTLILTAIRFTLRPSV